MKLCMYFLNFHLTWIKCYIGDKKFIHEFHENWHSESRILLRITNEFLCAVFTFIV